MAVILIKTPPTIGFPTDIEFLSIFQAPLIPTPTNAMERKINKLRVKYRIYMVEMDVEYVECFAINCGMRSLQLIKINNLSRVGLNGWAGFGVPNEMT
ncbi:hypothetical protein MTR_3g016025 [Medicago truncatula]|uniref:Uncharacterized protein n=1 Tax=Medicago truncatula TaxID=3880 RepID=A0A072UT83_MEDTR|nr:hypothetical protein MTR_3g016025 [Medicago truncatula]